MENKLFKQVSRLSNLLVGVRKIRKPLECLVGSLQSVYKPQKLHKKIKQIHFTSDGEGGTTCTEITTTIFFATCSQIQASVQANNLLLSS